jgi:hypothetical protein
MFDGFPTGSRGETPGKPHGIIIIIIIIIGTEPG